jgi:hypothetical protein
VRVPSCFRIVHARGPTVVAMTPMVETQLTVDDYAELQRFVNTALPLGRDLVKRARIVYLSVMVMAGAGFAFSAWQGVTVIWFLLALPVVTGIWIWFQVPRSAIKGARKIALRTYPSGVLPPARLWLDELGLNTDSAGVRVHYAWSTISKIDVTPTHAFVWVSERQAVIVPRRSGEQQVHVLIGALRAAIEYTRPPQQYGSNVYGA